VTEEDKITQFLSNFQELEDIINEKGGHKSRFNDNLMAVSVSNAYIRAKQGELLDLYALRNVYSHMQRGKYFASLTDHAVESLALLLKDIKFPPSALEIFAPKTGSGLYETDVNAFIKNVLSNMTENEYTHVPVWNGDKLVGTFAYNSFFQWVNYELQSHKQPHFEKERMGDISPRYLNGNVVRFQFVGKTDPAHEVSVIFESSTRQRKRLDCIFVTANGNRDEKILAIVTPWDLYKVTS
jgi:hypothetical protein